MCAFDSLGENLKLCPDFVGDAEFNNAGASNSIPVDAPASSTHASARLQQKLR
jgi:hypothetical protein